MRWGLSLLSFACYFFVPPEWLPAAAAGAALGHGGGADLGVLGIAAAVLVGVVAEVHVLSDEDLRVLFIHVPTASAFDLAAADDLDRASRSADFELEFDGVAHPHVLAVWLLAGDDMFNGRVCRLRTEDRQSKVEGGRAGRGGCGGGVVAIAVNLDLHGTLPAIAIGLGGHQHAIDHCLGVDQNPIGHGGPIVQALEVVGVALLVRFGAFAPALGALQPVDLLVLVFDHHVGDIDRQEVDLQQRLHPVDRTGSCQQINEQGSRLLGEGIDFGLEVFLVQLQLLDLRIFASHENHAS